ncbi:MAG TPA: hypothetical protein VF404_07380 [Sphingomonas sp.]
MIEAKRPGIWTGIDCQFNLRKINPELVGSMPPLPQVRLDDSVNSDGSKQGAPPGV